MNVNTWIENHACLKIFFEHGGRVAATADHEMTELIKYRNEAAHGSINIEDLPGLDFLYEFCDFVSAVCEALSERVQLTGLERMMSEGMAENRGKVSECLRSDLVLVGNVIGKFSVGDTIYLCGKDYCMTRSIENLQVSDSNMNSVDFGQRAELGIEINMPGRKKAAIVLIKSQ
jgi:hypothetical protein